MNDFSPTISDSGFNDVLAGSELYKILRVGQSDLMFPQNKDMLANIADFVNKFGDSLPRISQAMRKIPRGASPLEHISQFVNLQNKRMDLKESLKSLERELSMYE